MQDTFVRPGKRFVLPEPRPTRKHDPDFCPSGLRPGAVECWCILFDRPKSPAQLAADTARYAQMAEQGFIKERVK